MCFTNTFEAAKAAAVHVGKRQRFVNAGDVQKELKSWGYTGLGNAAGNIFSNKALFRSTGTKVANTNPSARGRKVTQWEYFGEGAPIVPGANVGAATVTSVNKVAAPYFVPSTPQNTKPGSIVTIKTPLQKQLTGDGKRSVTATVVEIIPDAVKWPLRVKFAEGTLGRLAYDEVEVASADLVTQ